MIKDPFVRIRTGIWFTRIRTWVRLTRIRSEIWFTRIQIGIWFTISFEEFQWEMKTVVNACFHYWKQDLGNHVPECTTTTYLQKICKYIILHVFTKINISLRQTKLFNRKKYLIRSKLKSCLFAAVDWLMAFPSIQNFCGQNFK